MKGIQAFALSKKFTEDTADSLGSLKGAPCQIDSIVYDEEAGTVTITFSWTGTSGQVQTDTAVLHDGEQGEQGIPGLGIKSTKVKKVGEEYHLIITYDDGTTEDAGKLPSGGGGGSAELEDDLTTAISVGGIASGVTYEAGTPLETLFRDLLEPTLYPTFTAPSAGLSYGASSYYAVGDTVNAMTATVSLNRGSINPAYGTSGYRSGTATGYSIATNGAATEYSDSSTSSGAFSVPALTRTTKGNIVVTGTVSYAEGEQPKDSKGNNYSTPLAAGSVTTTKTLQFILPYVYGASNSSTITDFESLNKVVTAKGQKTYNYTTNNQYMVFGYDSAYGNLKSILDGNGFETIGGWTKNTVTVDGFSYFVYVSNSPTTDTNAPFTFKY